MRIKTILRISTTTTISLALAIGLVFFTISRQLNGAIEKNRKAEEIVNAVFKLNIVNSDYLLHREERAKSQWYLKHVSLGKLIDELSVAFTSPENRAILNSIRRNHSQIKGLFARLVASVELQQNAVEKRELLQELKEKLVSQVALKSQTMVFGAEQLAENSLAEVVGVQRNANRLTMLSIVMLTAIMLLNSVLLSKRVIRPIARLRKVTEVISTGELDCEISSTGKDEIGQLAASFSQMLASLKNIVRQANTIATGDYTTDIVPRSDRDELGIAIRKMTKNLREVSAENERQDWIKTGIAELGDAIRGELELEEFGQSVLNYFAYYLDIKVGAFYVAEGAELLRMTSGYAYSGREDSSDDFAFGEGLVGQAAQRKNSILFTDVPKGYVTIRSAVGEASPNTIMVVPILFEGVVKGVLELGSFHELTEIQMEFVERAVENIGIALNSVQSRAHLKKLLEVNRSQAEELRSHQG